jgi:DNA-binding transcriptional LysR family regulator
VTDVKALNVFVAVANRGSFTHAAADLGVTQQAVSRAVAGLERDLGIELLARHSRGVRPTAAGAALLHDAERILADLDIALDRARQAADGKTGLLRIATTPAVIDAELVPIVDALRADVPAVELTFVELRPREIAPALRRGDVDVVLARTLPRADDLEVTALGHTPALVAVASDHRLARRRKITLSDLDGERLLVASARSPYTDLLLGHFARAGVRVTAVPARVLGLAFSAEVAAGAGVALVPRGTHGRAGVKLVAIDPAPPLPLLAAVRRWSARPIATRFLQAAKQECG